MATPQTLKNFMGSTGAKPKPRPIGQAFGAPAAGKAAPGLGKQPGAHGGGKPGGPPGKFGGKPDPKFGKSDENPAGYGEDTEPGESFEEADGLDFEKLEKEFPALGEVLEDIIRAHGEAGGTPDQGALDDAVNRLCDILAGHGVVEHVQNEADTGEEPDDGDGGAPPAGDGKPPFGGKKAAPFGELP
jgi:hypothetical protein